MTLISATKISEVDFKTSITFGMRLGLAVPTAWKWLKRTPKSSVRLFGGRHDFSSSEPFADGYLMIRSVTYGDLNGDGQDEAAVDLLYSPGGTANWHCLNEAEDKWQARVTRDWRFYFTIEGDTYILDIIRHPK